VLLLDEPAAGVPTRESRELFDTIKALPRDVTIVLIEHDMDLVFRFADRISVLVSGALLVEDVPEATTAVVRDPHQPRTWFVASEHRVFRSVDDGDGWEVVGAFDGRAVERLAVLPGAPGVVVAVARVGQTEACELLASADYGDTWSMIAAFEFHVEDVAPARLDGVPHAFLATDQGLFRVALAPGSGSRPRCGIAAASARMRCE
jgi:energy-coupling factor transporter ATP-binding protein EcfA2